MTVKKKTVTVLVYAGILLAIVIGFAVLLLNNHYSTKQSSFEITNNMSGVLNNPFSVDVVISKQWIDNEFHPEVPKGAQYDGTISNHTLEPINHWELEMDMPEEAVIDSSWNGNYSIADGKMVVTPLDYNEQIEPGGSITFGFVLYSEELIDFSGSTLEGHQVTDIYQSPVFIGLLALAGIWLVALIASITVYIRTAKYIKRQKHDAQIIMQSMNTFANMIDAKDTYTQGHSTRVAIYAKEIARRMKFSEEEIDKLYYIALMHDCGKIGIPDAVLKKPEKLTGTEWQMIQSHTTLGSNVLENFTTIQGIRDGALYHHERYDGAGYPAGLKGVDIPLYARIICIADSYDAMSSNRCYRGRMEQRTILSELENNAGSQFDPSIVKYMIAMIKDGFVDHVQSE